MEALAYLICKFSVHTYGMKRTVRLAFGHYGLVALAVAFVALVDPLRATPQQDPRAPVAAAK
jgi:hypothetical protein